MLTNSKPLSAGQAQTYHKEEFANAQENYYSEGDRIRGEWHGKLATEWGLQGDIWHLWQCRLYKLREPLAGAGTESLPSPGSIDDSSTSLSSSRTSRREKNEERLAGQSASMRDDH